jgi:hypothetical protein
MTLDEQERGPSRSRGSDVFVVEQDSFGGAVETPIEVPTPKPVIGAPLATIPATASSSRLPLAKISTAVQPSLVKHGARFRREIREIARIQAHGSDPEGVTQFPRQRNHMPHALQRVVGVDQENRLRVECRNRPECFQLVIASLNKYCTPSCRPRVSHRFGRRACWMSRRPQRYETLAPP